MAIETMSDILEEIANDIGRFGHHDEHCGDGPRSCRCCYVSDLNDRIRAAVEVERKLSSVDATAQREEGK